MRTDSQNQDDRDRAAAVAGGNAVMASDVVVCYFVSVSRRAAGEHMFCAIMAQRFFPKGIPVFASAFAIGTGDVSGTGVDDLHFVDPDNTLVENKPIVTKPDGFPSFMQRLYFRQAKNARQQKLLVLDCKKNENN